MDLSSLIKETSCNRGKLFQTTTTNQMQRTTHHRVYSPDEYVHNTAPSSKTWGIWGRGNKKIVRARTPENVLWQYVSFKDRDAELMIPQQYSCLKKDLNKYIRQIPLDLLTRKEEILWGLSSRQRTPGSKCLLRQKEKESSPEKKSLPICYTIPSSQPWNHTHTRNTKWSLTNSN